MLVSLSLASTYFLLCARALSYSRMNMSFGSLPTNSNLMTSPRSASSVAASSIIKLLVLIVKKYFESAPHPDLSPAMEPLGNS